MRLRLSSVGLLLLAAASARGQSPGSIVETTPRSREVDVAIGKAVEFLKSRQSPEGGWYNDQVNDSDGGRTALACMALINSGVRSTDPAIEKAVVFLRGCTSQRTYGQGLRAAFLAQVPKRQQRIELGQHVRWLQGAMIQGGAFTGMFSYSGDLRVGTSADFSNSQYGVLGVWYAAVYADSEVDISFWSRARTAWEEGQNADGGWGYVPSDARSYPSMTAAGVATLAVVQDYVDVSAVRNLNRISRNVPLQRGLEWLDKNFDVSTNGIHQNEWTHYMLYGYERVGEATGLTRFGDHDWYAEIAQKLLDTQAANGSWTATMGTDLDTSYALLVLSRARSPVAVQKYRQVRDDRLTRLDNRPRDVPRLVRTFARQQESHLNWQLVESDADDAHFDQSPMVYFASDRRLRLEDAERLKLQGYVNRGGTLVFINEGARDDLTGTAKSLCEEMFPGFKFRTLERTEPPYTFNFDAKAFTPPVLVLSNGVRDLAYIITGGDASWPLHAGGATDAQSPQKLLSNVFGMITQAKPLRKGQSTWLAETDPAGLPEASVIRLRPAGLPDAEPLAWERVRRYFSREKLANLKIESIPPADLPKSKSKLAVLSCSVEFKLSDDDAKVMKTFLQAGGTLLLDAAGASPAAQSSCEAMIKQIYPGQSLSLVPVGHPLYANLPETAFRTGAAGKVPGLGSPRLRGVQINKRFTLIYSPEDLTGSLVGYTQATLSGYTPLTGMTLMRNWIVPR